MCPRRGTFFSCVAKKRRQKKATPLSASLRFASGNLRCSRPAGSRSNSLRCASLRQSRALIRWPLRSSAHTEGMGSQTAIRAIASLGPLLWAQAPCAGHSACWVERSDDPNGCWGVHPLLAAPAAGRLRGGMGARAPMLRDLTRRGCPSGAAQQQSEFHGAPRKRTAAGLPRSAAQGSQTGGRLSFGYFSLAKQRKVPRPPGRTPGSRPPHRQAARSANQSRKTNGHSNHYQFNSYQRSPHKRQSPIQSKPKPHPTPATPHSPAPTAATAAGTQPPAPAAPHGTVQPPTCPASPPAPGAQAPSCARR